MSVQAAPFAGFTIASAAAFIEARTDEPFVTSHGEVPPDTRLPGTPKFQIANSLSYEIQVGPWVPGASLIHSHIGTSPNNLFATELLGGYDTLDVHAHLRLPAMMLQPRIALSLTNAGDVRGIAGAFADPVSPARDFYFVTPRTVSLTTTLTF